MNFIIGITMSRNKSDEEIQNPNIKILQGDSFKELSDRRIKEYRSKWKLNPSNHIVDTFPIHLDIESTSVCNLKCTFCASSIEKYSYGYMPMERYRRIIDEGAEKGLYSVKLNFRGEPLLHRNIIEMVSYAKKKGIVDVFFNTNATKLTEEIGTRLIESGLDRLIVSFEGYSPDIYEANRVGAVFENVVNNVRNFSLLRKKFNSKTPILRLQTVVISRDADYLDKYRAFWEEYADEITGIDMRDEAAVYSELDSTGWECSYPWRRLCITWDGNVLTCPFTNKADNKYEWEGLGAVDDRRIEDMWRGDEMARIRESHIKCDSHRIDPCRFCSYRGTELAKREPASNK